MAWGSFGTHHRGLIKQTNRRSALARIFHEPMLGEVKRLQVLRGAIFGLPLRRFEAICEFCRHRPQTPG